MYIIQRRIPDHGNWYSFSEHRYPTLEQAQMAFDKLHKRPEAVYRIAEEYTVTRYKAVR